jgi:low affinity Fe/Cu permease
MNNDTYLQKIKMIVKRMDELDTELMEYRNAIIRLENETYKLLQELYDELQKQGDDKDEGDKV